MSDDGGKGPADSGHEGDAQDASEAKARLSSDVPIAAVGETCDYCGAATLVWRKCKLVCLTCAQINKSCADL